MYKLLFLLLMLSTSLVGQTISGEDIDSLQNINTEYKIQISSRTTLDKRFFNGYDKIYETEVEIYSNGEKTFYRYLILPDIKTKEYSEKLLMELRFVFSNAFIVYYYNGKRYN